MDEQTIAALVKQIQEAKMPDWRMSLSDQIAYNLQVHTKGLIFDKVTGLFPNEHPDSQKHCINSYEPITTGSIWKAINNIIRVFNNSSYNIQISDKTREVIEQYQDNQGSFFSQFLEDWIKHAVATDPNGLCVWYPLEYTDDLYRYIRYKDLVTTPTNDTLIFVSTYESEAITEVVDRVRTKEIFHDYEFADGAPNIRYGIERTYHPQLAKRIVNHVYHAFTLTHFIRFYKDKPGDKEFKFQFWAHPKPLETLPYFENGGIEIEDGIYKSFVQEFVPFGNMALLAHRNQRAVELMHYFPKMSEVQQACDECSGKGETTCVKTDANPNGWETCKTCRGSKYVTIQSPYKVYKKVQDSFDVDGKVFSTPSVEYYTPPTGILEIVQKQWGFYVGQAEESVYVQRKVDTGNVESAEKKRIDQEGMHSWLANIAKVLYGNLQMGVQYLENYVNPSPITVSVEQPYSFAVLTETEAFEALNTMLMSSTPAPIKGNQVDTFVNKFISDSSPVKRALQILEKFDLLLYYSNEEVSNFKGNSWVDSKMCQLHVLAYPLLKKMYKLDAGLFDLEDDAIITKLTTEVAKYDLTKDLRTSVLNIPTNGVDA